MRTIRTMLIILAAVLMVSVCRAADVPQNINYQGKVSVGASPFTGVGQFKFALVDAAGTTSTWSNNGTSIAGSEPTAAVSLNVASGIFSVRLGDTSYPNMTQPITPTVLKSGDVWLRVWFNNGTQGFQKLGPDQKLSSAPYALVAGSLSANSINGPMLQRESVWPEHEGRGNTIVSYYAYYLSQNNINGNPNAPIQALGTIPAGKTFVITDIYLAPTGDSTGGANARVLANGITVFHGRVSTNVEPFAPFHVAFKAGIPIQSGVTLQLQADSLSSDGQYWVGEWFVAVSGFQFSN